LYCPTLGLESLRLSSVSIEHVCYYTRAISVRLRFNHCGRHELESFERHFDRLNDTASKVNFTCQNRTFSTDRAIGTSPLLQNGIFFGNHCNIYLCQATANNRQLLSSLVERTKTEQLNVNMSGITLLYYLLFMCFLHFMFISKQIDNFRFSYIQGSTSFILVCMGLILSHETKTTPCASMSTSVDLTEVRYRRQHFCNHLFVDQAKFNFWPCLWVKH
jgi:hypothetical protein